ncbi:MAG: polyprenyl synthetase family protein [Aquificae bacterium]|nr:polyprenyl synthetase family protein [Aquificota bacterium]
MDIKQYLKNYTEFIDQNIDRFLPKGKPSILFEAMEYSVKAGGKRLRPILVLESAKALGKNDINDIIDIAVATEFLHTYSLIHDDLPAMDDDGLRRGKPTSHIVYGEAIAILAGDGLQSYAFELISKNEKIHPKKLIKVINLLAHGTGVFGMVAGQTADILHEKEGTFDDIEFIHIHKTAKFIQVCCHIGAILADASQEEQEALANYGLNIGISFQIQDDILDIEGEEEKLGKKVRKDIEKSKLTYPLVYGLEESKKLAKKHVQEAISSIEKIKNPEVLINLAKFIINRDV